MAKILVLGVFSLFCLKGAFTQKMVERVFIRQFNGCQIKGTLFHMEKLSVNMTSTGATAVSGQIDADEDLPEITKLSMKVEKCTNYDDRDAGGCEYYTTLKYPYPCEDVIITKKMPWSPLFNTKPPLSCPIKKGTYLLQSVTFNPNTIRSPPGVYWRFILKLYAGNRAVSCIKGGLEIMSTRVRSSKAKGS